MVLARLNKGDSLSIPLVIFQLACIYLSPPSINTLWNKNTWLEKKKKKRIITFYQDQRDSEGTASNGLAVVSRDELAGSLSLATRGRKAFY